METRAHRAMPRTTPGDLVTANPTPSVWQVEVTPACVGSGMCIATAPQHFHPLDGYSQPRTRDVVGTDDLLAAAELCPMNAIKIRVTVTGDEVA